MLAIKLQRIGRKHQPNFRIVIAEKRSKMKAPPVEDIGVYDIANKRTSVKKERALYWISAGAKPTATVHNLLIQEGVLQGKKIAIKMRASKKAAETVKETGAPAVTEQKPEAQAEATPQAENPEAAES